MNAATETGRRHDSEKDGEPQDPHQITKMQENLRMLQRELKKRDIILSTENHLRRDERTYNIHIDRVKNKRKLSPGKKVLGENMQDNNDTSKHTKPKNRDRNIVTGTSNRPSQNGEHVRGSEGNGEGPVVYYRKKKLVTPPPHEIKEIEEFIPARKKKKHRETLSDDSSTNPSIKYIYEKKYKKKTKEVDDNSTNSPVESDVKLKKKKKNDLDFPMKPIPEEPVPKKRRKHKEGAVLEMESGDDRILEKGKKEMGKEKNRKKLSPSKILQKLVPTINEKNPSHLQATEINKNSIKKKKKRRPDRDELIEDFVAQIALNQSLIGDPANKRNPEQSYKNCTIQNHESTQILEVENAISDLTKSTSRKSKLNRKMNKSLSERSYRELDTIMDKWFKYELKNIGENKASGVMKKRRKSLELPRVISKPIEEKKKRYSVENPLTTTWVAGSNNACPNVIKRGQVRKVVEEKSSSPKKVNTKVIERVNVGDNQYASSSHAVESSSNLKKSNNGKFTGGTSSTTDEHQGKHSNYDKTNESEESLYKLIQELKEELGIHELFRILKEQWHISHSSKDTAETVDKTNEHSQIANNRTSSTKSKNKQKNTTENNTTASSSHAGEKTSKSTQNKLEILRDNMNEDFKKLIQTTALKEKKTKSTTSTPVTKDKSNNNSKGNLETNLSNDVNGPIYSPETLIQADVTEPLHIDTDEKNHQRHAGCTDSSTNIPVRIKHSPISIKDEHFGDSSSDSDTPQHQLDIKEENDALENNVELQDTQFDPDYVESEHCVVSVDNSEVNSSLHREELRNDKDAGKIDFFGVELTARQQQVLRDLEVILPFVPPPSHQIESRMSTFPSKEQLQEFKHLGIQIKKGKFSMDEDALIRRNWHDFIKEHGIPNDPIPFLYFYHPFSNSQILLSRGNVKKFVQYLGRDLNNRMLNCIHGRFKMLFMKVKKGRFTAEEDEMIMNLLEQYKDVKYNIYSKIARKLNRARTSIEQRCKLLQLQAKFGDATTVIPNEMIVRTMMDTLKYNNVEELKNKNFSRNTYNVFGKKLNMIPVNVKFRWLSTIYPALFSKTRDMNEVKRRFISLLIKKQITDARKIKFSCYAKKYFEGCTGRFLSQIFRAAMQKAPKEYNIKEALLYLQENVLDSLPEVPLATINVNKS